MASEGWKCIVVFKVLFYLLISFLSGFHFSVLHTTSFSFSWATIFIQHFGCHLNTLFVYFCSGCRNPDKQVLTPHDVFQLTGLIDLISTVFTSDPSQPVLHHFFLIPELYFILSHSTSTIIKSLLGTKELIICFLNYAPCTADSVSYSPVLLINTKHLILLDYQHLLSSDRS